MTRTVKHSTASVKRALFTSGIHNACSIVDRHLDRRVNRLLLPSNSQFAYYLSPLACLLSVPRLFLLALNKAVCPPSSSWVWDKIALPVAAEGNKAKLSRKISIITTIPLITPLCLSIMKYQQRLTEKLHVPSRLLQLLRQHLTCPD